MQMNGTKSVRILISISNCQALRSVSPDRATRPRYQVGLKR
jgi:hypothetical protein